MSKSIKGIVTRQHIIHVRRRKTILTRLAAAHRSLQN